MEQVMAKPEKQEDVKYDPRAMPLARVEQRTVRDPLDTELMVEISHQLGRLRRRIDDTNEALKDYAKAQRGEIAEMEAERDELIDTLDSGREVVVDCEIRLVPDGSRRLVIRRDTGEIIADEPAQDGDFQTSMFGGLENIESIEIHRPKSDDEADDNAK